MELSQTIYKQNILHEKGCETMEQVAHRGGRSPIPETFKVRLDKVLNNPIWLKIPVLIEGDLD